METVTRKMVSDLYREYLDSIDRQGDMKIQEFSSIYASALPVQQKYIDSILNSKQDPYLQVGNILSFAVAYSFEEIDIINRKNVSSIQKKEFWNSYAENYDKINHIINNWLDLLHEHLDGIPIYATLSKLARKVNHAKDYFPLTFSHRHVGQSAGMGWRGKNNLIIHPKYGPAFRFGSFLTLHPFPHDDAIVQNCGNCVACLKACPILNNQHQLEDYRENCRRYLIGLNLKYDVCGKCIKACITNSQFASTFQNYLKKKKG